MREEEGQKEREMVEKIGQKEGQFSASGRNSFHLRDSYTIHFGGAGWLFGFHPCKAVGSGNSTVRS